MRALLIALLATPLAAAAGFVALPAPVEAASPCGADACFPIAPSDAAVRIEGGRAYSFRALDGGVLAEGTLCGAILVPVPAGAVMLRVDPAPCG